MNKKWKEVWKMNNRQLYWYGVISDLKVMGGELLVAIGIIALLFRSYYITAPCLILGVVLFANGKSQRFDYQRRSGAILHKGDW